MVGQLQTQYLVVQVEEVGVLLTDISLGVRDQLPDVPVGTGTGRNERLLGSQT